MIEGYDWMLIDYMSPSKASRIVAFDPGLYQYQASPVFPLSSLSRL